MQPAVAAQIQKIVAEGKAELAQYQQRVQERVNAGVAALCRLEADRLGIQNPRLSDDLTALETSN
jgi:hypothetical protein